MRHKLLVAGLFLIRTRRQMLWLFHASRISVRWRFHRRNIVHLQVRFLKSAEWFKFFVPVQPKCAAGFSFPSFAFDIRHNSRLRIMSGDVNCCGDLISNPSKNSGPFSVVPADGESESITLGDTTIDASQYSILREGEADILLHGNDVFYNKAQIVNRDISIAVIRAFVAKREEENSNDRARKQMEREVGSEAAFVDLQIEELKGSFDSGELLGGVSRNASLVKSLRVLEALAASGLRALRYAKEIDGVGLVVATDNDKVAFEACKRNIRFNGQAAASKVEAKLADARVFMLTHEKDFDVVDLDPYGSPSIFLDSAVQTVADGGLLFCTATDMAVLCGNNGEVCYSKYGSYPLRGKYCHEMALRILLASIESHANRYKRHIVPLLSISVDFYVRVFVRIFTSAKMVKATPSKLSHVYQCVGCDSYHLQPVGRISYKNNSTRYMPGTGPAVVPECQECGRHYNMGGPMWAAPLHDPSWVHQILTNATAMKKRYPAFDKLHSILTATSEELVDVPLYLSLHSMSATLKCTPPSATLFRSAVANAGYRISGTHANPLGIKTDAPMSVLWDIMRCWVKTHPVKQQAGETAGAIILSKEPKLEANFVKVSSALSKAQSEGVARFLPNPEEFWGPKPRAGRRRLQNQLPAEKRSVAGNVHARDTNTGDMSDDAKRRKQDNERGTGTPELDVNRNVVLS